MKYFLILLATVATLSLAACSPSPPPGPVPPINCNPSVHIGC